ADCDNIAYAARVVGIMRFDPGTAPNVLLIKRVLRAPLDQHHDGLVHAVADDPADQNPLPRAGCCGACLLTVVHIAYQLLLCRLLFTQHGFDARYIATNLAELVRLGQLPCCLLHAQIELLPTQGQQLLPQLGSRLFAQFTGFHVQLRWALYRIVRSTKVVCTGSLEAAKRIASWATARSTPTISYIMVPG